MSDSYNHTDKMEAMKKAMEFGDKIPIGVLYRENRVPYHRSNSVLKANKPLIESNRGPAVINQLIKEFI